MKKIISILCLSCFILSSLLSFIGCTETNSNETIESNTKENQSTEETLQLVKNNEALFTIVADSGFGKSYQTEFAKYNVTTSYVDFADAPTTAKFYIANLSSVHSLPAELMEKVPYFGYYFGSFEGNYYVVAYEDSILSLATSDFFAKLAECYKDGNLSFTDSDHVTVEVSSKYKKASYAPAISGGLCEGLFDCDDDNYLALVDDVTESEFNTYCDKLTGVGYNLYTSNEINGNLFHTYLLNDNSGTHMLYVYLTLHDSKVHIITGLNPTLQSAVAESYESVCTPFIKQIDCTSGGNEGMGYIIRLCDGRFVIVDGGYKTNACAKQIYDTIKDNALDKDHIVIACWYISHFHSDHIGAYKQFLLNYCENNYDWLTVESFAINQNLTNAMAQFCDTSASSATDSFENFVNHYVTSYFPTAKLYKPFAGQILQFADLKINVLYTISDFWPSTILNESDATVTSPLKGDYNTESMVSIFTIENTTICMMADTVKSACDEMVARYGTALKSDYVQISHHGIAPTSTTSIRRLNSTKEFYKMVDPANAFLPCSYAKKAERMNYSVNLYLKSFISYYKGKIYCAGEEAGQAIIEIPVVTN